MSAAGWWQGTNAQRARTLPVLRSWFCLLLVLLPISCGYRFAVGPTLPQGIQSLSFAEFQNETLEVGIEKELQWALEREFRTRGGIAVVDKGEGIVSATLHRLDLRPLSFDRRDQVLQYELALLFDVAITHRDTGQVLWQASNVRVAEDYSAVPQVTVTTSPRFFQGTLNPEDLAGLTDIQFSEAQRRLALERLFAEAAREIYFRLGDNF
ncbi:MAG: LPS assembly lipoprotein LptE [Candidatus Binatia bacterium]|nr:LPS assembly lipoprotein LptE [Candidatus Binatia bacterium]